MKKVLGIALFLFVVIFSTVNVYGAEGLNSTWYQKIGVQEGDEATAIFADLLGNDTDPAKNWDNIRENLFAALEEKGKVVVDTFEVPDAKEDTVWREYAEEAGIAFVGNEEWAPNYVVVKYEGYILAKEAGEYQFNSSFVDNGFVCYIDGNKVFEFWGKEMWYDSGKEGTQEGTKFTMEAYKPYKFEAYYMEEHGGEILSIDVVTSGGEKAFVNSGLYLFTGEPTADEIELVKNPPTPAPTTAKPTPEPPTAKPATARPTAAITASEGAAFSIAGIYIIIGIIGVVVLAIIGIVVFIAIKSKKKK